MFIPVVIAGVTLSSGTGLTLAAIHVGTLLLASARSGREIELLSKNIAKWFNVISNFKGLFDTKIVSLLRGVYSISNQFVVYLSVSVAPKISSYIQTSCHNPYD